MVQFIAVNATGLGNTERFNMSEIIIARYKVSDDSYAIANPREYDMSKLWFSLFDLTGREIIKISFEETKIFQGRFAGWLLLTEFIQKFWIKDGILYFSFMTGSDEEHKKEVTYEIGIVKDKNTIQRYLIPKVEGVLEFFKYARADRNKLR